MSQHDFNIANSTFSATRTDLNNAFGALATNSAGDSAPSTTYANQWWFDSDGNQLYMRNKDNDAWVEVLTIGATSDAVESIGATGRFDIASAETVFNESSADLDFRVESNGNTHMLFVDGGNNKIGIGSSTIPEVLTANEPSNGAITGISINNNFATSSTATAGTGSGIRFGVNDASFTSAFGDARGSEILSVTTATNGRSRDIVFKTDTSGTLGEKMRIHSSGGVCIGQTTAPASNAGLGIASTTSGDSASMYLDTYAANQSQSTFFIRASKNNTVGTKTETASGQDIGSIYFQGVNSSSAFGYGANITATQTGSAGSSKIPTALIFGTATSSALAERMRILGSGELCLRKTSTTFGTAGSAFGATVGEISSTVDGAPIMYINRLSSDGNLVQFHQASTHEGTISVSGSTVSYSGFTGTHWSRLSDNSKPTILRGTIMDSIDEMCDWYQVVADLPEVLWTADDLETQDILYTADDVETQDVLYTEDEELPEGVEVGDVKEPSTQSVGDMKQEATQTVGEVKEKAYTVKESIALGDKSVGDAITFTSNGTEYTGTIFKEDDVKHTKCKVSDTADSKKVYGVFSNWDDEDDGLDGDVNDMNIAQVGTYIIRVNADEAVEAGDLLVSNGDGTAKVQDDDIIRSKTVAKVNSTVKIETYADGSYTVPCTLHC